MFVRFWSFHRSRPALWLAAWLAACASPQPGDLEPPVARAGDISLSRAHIELAVDAVRTFGTDKDLFNLRREAARAVLSRKLKALEARRRGLDADPEVKSQLERLDETVALDIYALELGASAVLSDQDLEARLAPSRARASPEQLEFRSRQYQEMHRMEVGTARRVEEIDRIETQLEAWVSPDFVAAAAEAPSGSIVARAGAVQLSAEDVWSFLPRGRVAETTAPERRVKLIRQALAVRVLARRKIAEGVLAHPAYRERREADVESLLADALEKAELRLSLEQEPISPRAYYDANPHQFDLPEEVRARHILLGHAEARPLVATRSRSQAEALAQELLGRLRSGESFESVAQTASDLADKSGDLGWFKRGGGLEPVLEQAAFDAAAADFAGPVETRHGFHLVQRLDRRIPGRQPFEAVEESLGSRLRAERRRLVRARLDQSLEGPAGLVLDPEYFGKP